MTTGKTIALTIQTSVSIVCQQSSVPALNTLSRFVIAFLPRSKCLLISWLHSASAVILEPKKIKSVTVSIVSPSICREVLGPDAMIFIFWMLSFKPAFSLSSTSSLVPLHFHLFTTILGGECWVLNQLFHSPLSHSSRGSLVPLHFHLFTTIRVVSSAYLRLLIFLLAILSSACDSSISAFPLRYSAYKLNKQGDNLQPRHTPIPIWNQSIVCIRF